MCSTLSRRIGSLIAALGLSVLAVSAQADGFQRVDQTVFGMDCAPCAYGIQKGLEKLPGVLHATVTLNDGKAVVDLAPDNQVTLAEIREVIRHNGFTPKDASVTASGTLQKSGDRYYLSVNSATRLELRTANPSVLSSVPVGAELTVEGRVPESTADVEVLEVVSVGRSGHPTP